MDRRFSLWALAMVALLGFQAEAGAQTRTAVVVPAGAAVVVPPRGVAALPRATARRPAGQRPRLPPMEPARREGGLDLGGAGTVAAVLLPAIAAAALTAALSNGGSGGNHGVSGPARTR
ncbi:MAG: hypothetical protein ICV73_19080 [Acetobacteraceae bacterium]|nr:hypothetical protein [Acetobacteraceae bacterium]